MLNFAICCYILKSHKIEKKSKAKDKNKKVKLQFKDQIKILDIAKSITESNNILIKKLSLLKFNVKIEKNGILKSDNKDLVFLISQSTLLPKYQSLFFFLSLFDFIPPIVYKPPLLIKSLKKDTLKL